MTSPQPPPVAPQSSSSSSSTAPTSSSTEVSAMLEMLSMAQYAPGFAKNGVTTIHSLLPALDDPKGAVATLLKQLVPKTQERTILLGYLSIRRRKDPREAEENEKRLHTFRVVKDTLNELQNLQIKKAELERGSKSVLERKESVRQEIEHLLDKIEDAKAKLESAQSELNTNSNSTNAGGRAAAARPWTARPKSKTGSKTAGARMTTDEPPRSPRVANEREYDAAPDRRRRYEEEEQAAAATLQQPMPSSRGGGGGGGGVQDTLPSSSSAGSSLPQGTTRVEYNDDDDDDGFGPTTRPARPKSAGYDFGASIQFAHDSNSRGEGKNRNAEASKVRMENLKRDVGPGWNKNSTVPRMRHVATHSTVSQWGAGRCVPLTTGGADVVPSAATTTTTTIRNPAAAGSSYSSSSRSSAPLDLSVRGQRATPIALGVNLENDHYAQMCCGALGKQL